MTDLKIIMRIARTDLAILFYSPIAWFILIVFIPDNSKFYVIDGEYSDRL